MKQAKNRAKSIQNVNDSESEKILPQQIVGFLVAVVILVGMHLIPTSESFPVAARNTLGVLVAVIIMLVTETMSIGIVCLLAIPLLYFFGCTPSVGGALSGFTNATLFFVLASFGISKALTCVPVTKRVLLLLMRRFGKNTRQLLFAIMFVTALLSSLISNVASAAVFVPLVLEFLNVYEDDEARKQTGRAYMIGIPVASMIGGMMTPASSSLNLLSISLLEQGTGQTITFVQWMVYGTPLAIVMMPLAWLVCVRVFPPAPLGQEKIQAYIQSEMKKIPPRLTLKEIFAITVMGVMLVLWILSSWVPALHITAVAMCGLVLYSLPGKLQILTWDRFRSSVSLEAILLMGVMISIGNVVKESGLSVWIANVIFPASFPSVTFLGLLFVSVLTFLLLIPIPVAPALISMLSASLIAFSTRVGLSPALAMLAFGLCVSNCYLFPLDTVPLMTYVTKYYKMMDMPRVTARLQLALAVCCSAWVTLMGFVVK